MITNEIKDKKWSVYIHTFPNNKKYVGITSLPVEHRWNHGKNYNGVMKYAIEKYGWDNIQHEIIADGLSETEAKEMEVNLISELHTRTFENGYNMTEGGDGKSGYTLSEETKGKISKSNTGKKRTPEQIENIRKNTPVKRYEESPKSISVYQFDLEKNFINKYCNAVKAAEVTNFEAGGIRKACNFGVCSYKNFHWRYEKDVIFIDGVPTLGEIRNNNGIKKVHQFYADGKYINTYDSVAEASRKTGIHSTVIGKCAKNKTKWSKMFLWRYDDGIKYEDGTIKIVGEHRFSSNCHETEIYQFTILGTYVDKYKTILAAGKAVGLKGNTGIISVAKHRRKSKTAGGYVWRYKDDVEALPDGTYKMVR